MVTEPGVEITWGELHVGAVQAFAAAGFREVSAPTQARPSSASTSDAAYADPAVPSADETTKPRGKQEVVEALLHAAARLFAERGPAAVSLRDVAARPTSMSA